jgi:hypothetical protein
MVVPRPRDGVPVIDCDGESPRSRLDRSPAHDTYLWVGVDASFRSGANVAEPRMRLDSIDRDSSRFAYRCLRRSCKARSARERRQAPHDLYRAAAAEPLVSARTPLQAIEYPGRQRLPALCVYGRVRSTARGVFKGGRRMLQLGLRFVAVHLTQREHRVPEGECPPALFAVPH